MNDCDCVYCWTLLGLVGRHKQMDHQPRSLSSLRTVEQLAQAVKIEAIEMNMEKRNKNEPIK